MYSSQQNIVVVTQSVFLGKVLLGIIVCIVILLKKDLIYLSILLCIPTFIFLNKRLFFQSLIYDCFKSMNISVTLLPSWNLWIVLSINLKSWFLISYKTFPLASWPRLEIVLLVICLGQEYPWSCFANGTV